MHREDRTAFPVKEALDLLETKILDGVENRYKNKFAKFIEDLEEIEVTKLVGVVTYLANEANRSQRHDISGMLRTILKIRELLGGPVNEHKVLKLEKMEKVQDKFWILQFLQKIIEKTKEKIASLSKILRGYKRLSEGSKGQELEL